MKKLLLAFAIIFGLSATAQKNVYLKIDHFLSGNAFALNTAASNNLGNSFNVNRMQYYISNIVIVHDGGQQTAITNKWILVNATATVNEMLGSFNITTVEAVKFAIGVEQAYNHLDPASYPMSHPLAPKSPSMHWGWSGGYIFAAMDGNGGAALNQPFELHGLGDNVYYTLTLPTAGIASSNDIIIGVNADYAMALKNIDVSSGGIVHSEAGAAKTLLQNFSYNVFTSAEGNASMATAEFNGASAMQFYPNPTRSNVTITHAEIDGELEYVVLDLYGKIVAKNSLTTNGNTELNFNTSGVFFISILKDGATLRTEKIVVTN